MLPIWMLFINIYMCFFYKYRKCTLLYPIFVPCSINIDNAQFFLVLVCFYVGGRASLKCTISSFPVWFNVGVQFYYCVSLKSMTNLLMLMLGLLYQMLRSAKPKDSKASWKVLYHGTFTFLICCIPECPKFSLYILY